MARDQNRAVRLRLIGLAGVVVVITAAVVAWALHASVTNHWLAVHTGTVNESGPYYGFWSGFGSDIAEFGVLGAIGTAAYQLFKKYNCHEPGCWRVGTHPAAGGQFVLCYRHHPDYQSKRPTHDLIARMHRQYAQQQAVLDEKIRDIHQHVITPTTHDDRPQATRVERTRSDA